MSIMHTAADLVALDALLRTGSVSAAARALGLTQSAVSHTLARLRVSLGDPLFVRAGRRLVPTRRAEAMAPELRRAILSFEAAVAAPASFDPPTARRHFRIGMPDYGELVLLPRLAAAVARLAPSVDLTIVRASADELMAGEVEVLIQPARGDEARAGLRARALFRDAFVCVLRRGHPLLAGPLEPAAFAAAGHLLIAPRGRPGGVVDDTLREMKLSRRTVVQVTGFLAAPHVVASSDLVLTLAARIAQVVAVGLPLEVLPHPLPLPGFTTSMIWHERDHDDPGHLWLRSALVAAAEGLPSVHGAALDHSASDV